ncbi:MAG: LCP family protein [Acidimicrobiales bacterium]
MIGANLAIVVSALLSAFVLAYARDTVSSIPRTGFGAVLDPAEEEVVEGEPVQAPINFLLVGVDSIGGLPPDHPLRATRAEGNTLTDTMIVLRVEPETGAAAALSLPRDLWVPIAEPVGHESKLNGALALGGQVGRETLVTTVQDFLDIPIHRYVEVDFNGFLELVDEIGGVSVFVEYPLRDVKAQFEVSQTGCVDLTPEQALGYVRSRTLQALIDGTWQVVDGRGDLGRIERQQDFLVVALKQAFSEGLTNPATLKGIVDNVWAAGYVRLDDITTPGDLVDLARDFSGFDAEELNRLTLPVTLGTAGDLSVVRLMEAEAQDVLDVFRGEADRSRSFRVAVRNGVGRTGLAQEVEAALVAEDFRVVEATNADNFLYATTVIEFDPSQHAAALELERWLVAGATLQERDAELARPVDLIVGADWEGVLTIPRPLVGAAPTPTATAGPTQVVNTETAPTPTPTPPAIASIRGCG